MKKDDILNLVDKFLKLKSEEIQNAQLFAFKSKKCSNNPLISLDYEVYDTLFNKQEVINNIFILLDYFKNKNLNADTLFDEYKITNSKDVIDYISRKTLDFSDESIKNGTSTELDSNKYKIEYFLNAINSSSKQAKNSSDYKGIRYSLLKLSSTEVGEVYIINKSNPLYKPKGILYAFEEVEQETANPIFSFLNSKFFRIPNFPSMIIFDKYCFFISNNIENMFGFEQHNKKTCDNVVLKLKTCLNLEDSSFEIIEKAAKFKKNYNLFADFDSSNLKSITEKHTSTLSILKDQLNLPIDSNFNLKIENLDQAQLLIYFITDSIKRDLTNNTLFVTRNSKKISEI